MAIVLPTGVRVNYFSKSNQSIYTNRLKSVKPVNNLTFALISIGTLPKVAKRCYKYRKQRGITARGLPRS